MPGPSQTSSRPPLIIPKDTKAPVTTARQRLKRPRLLTILFSLLAVIALVHFIIVFKQAGSSNPAPTTCANLMNTLDYPQLVHLQPKAQEMGAVQFVDQLVGGQPATLVQVMNTGTHPTLDVYVFSCTMHKNLPVRTTLFTQRNLIGGTVSVSPANTLITSELDPNVSPALVQPLQQNVYREYSWQHGAFVQTSYPSLYPVISRAEAEALQTSTGHTLPWSDPLLTAQQMAKDIFKRTTISPLDALKSNNGLVAQVQLVQQSPPLTVMVTLQRLVQHTPTGLWFVTAARTNNLTLLKPSPSSPVTSPAIVNGNGALADGQTSITLFDHTLTPMTLLNNPTLNTAGSGAYSGTLFYSNSVQNQPGVLLIQSIPPAGSNEAGQLLLSSVIWG